MFGLPGLKPGQNVPHQKTRASAPRQVDGWGEVLGTKVKGVTHRPGVRADRGGKLGEVDGEFEIDIVHAICRAWEDLMLICTGGRAHWAPPA